jgi:hypothetical protein
MESIIPIENTIQVETQVKAKRVYTKRPKNIVKTETDAEVPGETIVYEPPPTPSAPIDIPKAMRAPSVFAAYYKENFNKYTGSASSRMKEISAEYRRRKEALEVV